MTVPKILWGLFLLIDCLYAGVSTVMGNIPQLVLSLVSITYAMISYSWILRMEDAELFNEELSWKNHESQEKTDEGL